jgi:acetyl esterase/lipase
MPWLFLLAAGLGAALTANAYVPLRMSKLLHVQSFFAGWLTSEAPLHHLALQACMAAYFVMNGGLDAAPGWLALALAALSCFGLFHHFLVGNAAHVVIESALQHALGAEYRAQLAELDIDGDIPRGRSLVPVWLTDPNVRVIRDIAYGPAGRRNTLDIYLPRGELSHAPDGIRGVPDRFRGHPAPVLFQIHGGGWSISHKGHQAKPLMHYMAARGWICVAINYGLSPRTKFPGHLVDVKRALIWVKQHIAEYGGDPELIVCTGGSAGGHLTALTALTANDPRYQPEAPHVDTRVQAAVVMYGVFDFCNREGLQRHDGLRGLLERYVIGQPFASARELYESGSPLGLVHESAPPFFVVHGTNDGLACVEEARMFVERLRAVSQAPVAYAELPLAQHAFEVFHSPRTLHAVRAVHRFAEVVRAAHRTETGRPPAESYIRELTPKARVS